MRYFSGDFGASSEHLLRARYQNLKHTPIGTSKCSRPRYSASVHRVRWNFQTKSRHSTDRLRAFRTRHEQFTPYNIVCVYVEWTREYVRVYQCVLLYSTCWLFSSVCVTRWHETLKNSNTRVLGLQGCYVHIWIEDKTRICFDKHETLLGTARVK